MGRFVSPSLHGITLRVVPCVAHTHRARFHVCMMLPIAASAAVVGGVSCQIHSYSVGAGQPATYLQGHTEQKQNAAISCMYIYVARHMKQTNFD